MDGRGQAMRAGETLMRDLLFVFWSISFTTLGVLLVFYCFPQWEAEEWVTDEG